MDFLENLWNEIPEEFRDSLFSESGKQMAKTGFNKGRQFWPGISALFKKKNAQKANPVILVLGAPGAGKSVLGDYLQTPNGLPEGYQLPHQGTPETEQKADHANRAIWIFPGDHQGSVRNSNTATYIDVISGEHESQVEGVVYAISNGFLTPYLSGVENTINEYLRRSRETEFLLFSKFCELVAKSKNPPRWILIALTKADLYHYSPGVNTNTNTLDAGIKEAVERYRGHSKTGLLADYLRRFVGYKNLAIRVAPVCCYPCTFPTFSEDNDLVSFPMKVASNVTSEQQRLINSVFRDTVNYLLSSENPIEKRWEPNGLA